MRIEEKKELCNCSKCKCKSKCMHSEAFRRLPREIGGLGLCKNLNK